MEISEEVGSEVWGSIGGSMGRGIKALWLKVPLPNCRIDLENMEKRARVVVFTKQANEVGGASIENRK